MRVLSFALIALCATVPASAQVTASAGAVLPIGEFSRTEPGSDDGFAEPGFGALVFLDAPFAEEGTRGLAFSGTLGALAFPTDEESFSPFREDDQPSASLEPRSERGSWVVIPVLGGLRYEWAGVNEDLALIGSLQGGVSVVSLPSLRYELTNSPQLRLLTREAGIEAAVTGSAGVAVALFDRLEIGINVFVLRTPTFTVEESQVRGTDVVTGDVELRRPIAATAFTLGYRF